MISFKKGDVVIAKIPFFKKVEKLVVVTQIDDIVTGVYINASNNPISINLPFDWLSLEVSDDTILPKAVIS